MTVAALVLMSAVACGNGSAESEYTNAMTYELYFDSFGSDFEPAASLAELADRSDVVTLGRLVDVVDGPIFADDPADPLAARYAIFVFETDDGIVPVVMDRPNTSRIETLKPVMPLNARAALYLHKIEQLPDDEAQLWHGLELPIFTFTTPQGLIWEQQPGDPATIDAPIHGGSDFPLADAPAAGSAIESWVVER
jgi:hypothetical protein